MGVPKHLLPAQHAVMAKDDVLTVRKCIKLHQTFFEPLLIGVLCCQRVFDFVIPDDPPEAGVDEEHFAGLQTSLANHSRRVDIDNPNFGGHHNKVVVGHPVPTGTQSVAIQYRPDHCSIGKGHAGRAIPWLHQRGVEAIESATRRIH